MEAYENEVVLEDYWAEINGGFEEPVGHINYMPLSQMGSASAVAGTVGEYEYKQERYIGVFNIGLETGEFDISIPDGDYKNLLDESKIIVKNSNMTLRNNPIIIRVKS